MLRTKYRSVVRRESAHARILEGILNGELRACVDSRHFCDNGPVSTLCVPGPRPSSTPYPKNNIFSGGRPGNEATLIADTLVTFLLSCVQC